VHKPAKYLSEPIRRVLFVGGGDSGVLNEFLKYPSLELIVGLELDQTVTRQSFKHFASRPSFDNPKVEWWYGDASKSLLMLPKQYFGTFDFVVVDLSDTVFSLSVSSELDVIEAISLLLRPGGIFEMNELFLKKVGNVFEYAIHYQFTDVPKICDQAAIFASNDIDFMNTPLTEHILVENATILVEKESLRTKHQFDRVHDFRRNPVPKSKRLCKIAEGVEQEDRPQQQAPGILMIVEAENLTVDLNSPEEIKKVLVGVLQDLDLQVLPDDKPSSSPWFVIGMKEGYLTVRLFPESRYCALDIHLWSAFDKHGIVKEAVVVKGLGGDLLNRSTSSYRIVAGGMFGLPTWKEDAATHGPQISRTCPKYAEPLRDSPSNANKFEEAVEISLDVAQGENLVVAVLCGPEGEACPSVEVAERNEKVKQVITIHACTSENDYASSEDRSSSEDMDSENAVGSCIAKKAYDLLNQALPEDDDKIHVIIYDFNAPEITSEAIDVMYVHEHMNIEKVVMMATTDSRKELWRRRHIATIRQIVRMDPVHRAHIFLNTTKSSLELSLIATGDEFFFDHLAKAVASSQAKTDDVSLEIRNIFGGLWREKKVNWKNDTEFSQVIVDDDYDNSDAKNQWETQVPLANQTVTQFVNCETGSYNVKTFACTLLDVDREDLLGACEESFKLFDSTMQIYDDIGGDGLVCSGTWETGTAIILWDGRYQVDLNLWTLNQLEELDAFKNAVLHGIPTLKQKLRDIQPRGYGRVVNFKFDLKTKSEKKFVNWAGMPIVDVP
jgi:spermidine synthase